MSDKYLFSSNNMSDKYLFTQINMSDKYLFTQTTCPINIYLLKQNVR